MQWNIDDVPIFVAVVEEKGFSAAADSLGISKSAVSKSLTRLEAALGVRLMERNSRNHRVTSEGEVFYRQGLLIMEQVHEAERLLSGLVSSPSGKLTVSMPMAFTREIVAPRLGDFRSRFPDVELDIIVTSHSVDIIRDQIDLAVVVGAQGNSELVIRTLYESRLVCVASPAYARDNNLGSTIDDLQAHIQVCETRYANPRFPLRVKGQKKHIDLKTGTLHINDPVSVRDAVIHGAGVALVPNQYCRNQLHNGELVRVFEHMDFDVAVSVVSAIYPSRRLISNKTRAFLDFLIDICGQI